MVNVHMFFLGSTGLICMGWPRGGFLDRLMNPLLAHLGWHSPLVDTPRKVGGRHFRVDSSSLSLTGSNYSRCGNEINSKGSDGAHQSDRLPNHWTKNPVLHE